MVVRAVMATLVLIALAQHVAADGAGVVALAARDPDAAAAADAIARAMHGRSSRVVAHAVREARASHAAGAVPVEALAAFRRVRAQLDEGWQAYLRVAVDVAAARLATARADAEALVALEGGAELYADVALRLGVVLHHLGRHDQADIVFRLALALDPDRPITVAELAPEIVEAVEAARRADVPQRTLAIETEPAGARVFVDGRDAGKAPVDVPLRRGQHLVVARLPGHEPVVQAVPIDTEIVRVVLRPDREAASLAVGAVAGMDDRATTDLLGAVARYAELDEIVVVNVTVRRGGPALLVQRCAGAPLACSAVVDVGYDGEAALVGAARAAWDAARIGELRYPPSVFRERDGRRDDDRCRVCRSPWLWTGLGAAVVTATVLVIVAATADAPPTTVGVDGRDFHR